MNISCVLERDAQSLTAEGNDPHRYNILTLSRPGRIIKTLHRGFPGGTVVKNLPANARDAGVISGLRRSPGEGTHFWKWQLTPVFLPGKSYGQRSTVGCTPWVPKSRT